MQERRADAVVIGSGLGGVAIAARLATAGMHVVMVERMARLGGRASSEPRKGFFIPTGAIGIEAGGAIERTFDDLGIEFPIVRPPYPQVQYRIRGRDVQMPEKGGLRVALDAAADTPEEADAVQKLMAAGIREEPPADLTVDEWLTSVTQNPDLLGIFRRMIPAIHGINADEMPARELVRFITRMRGYREYGYVKGGTIGVPQALADRVVERGGEVLLSCPARSVEVVDGRARSVIVQPRGEELTRIMADVVVSDIGPRATLELVGENALPSDYVSLIRSMKPPVPLIAVFYASDEPITDFVGMTIPTRTRLLNIAIQPTHLVPELAPPGRHLLMTMGAPAVSDAPVDWKALEADMLADADDMFPGIHERSEVLVKLHYHGEWPVIRAWAGNDAPHTTPLDNLFLVGDGAKPSGFAATPACFEGARLVADDVLGAGDLAAAAGS
jgi:phytoene desaturase